MADEPPTNPPMSNRQFQAEVATTRTELQSLIDRNAALLETVTGRQTILRDVTVEELASNAETREWVLEWARTFSDFAVEEFQKRIENLTQQRDSLSAIVERN